MNDNDDRYAPVSHASLARQWFDDPDFQREYAALDDEFAALDELLAARKRAGLSQGEVAERMGIKQPSLARIESALGTRKHSPSLATLRRYAKAVGCRLVIHLEPTTGGKRR